MATSIFGTDGVRGTPGQYPLDEETIARLGAATARSIHSDHPKLLVARDTRESGHWIEQHLATGVAAGGGVLVSIGVMPTPAAAFLVRAEGFDGAFVISASHNPFPDNGIKILTCDGIKASLEFETKLSRLVQEPLPVSSVAPHGKLETLDLMDSYLVHVRKTLNSVDRTHSTRIAIDCANGATSIVAPRLFRELGFEVVVLNAEPDGRNINEMCGSTSPDQLQQSVRLQGCELGVALDGDGDRAILVDQNGVLLDGDAILFICATHLASIGELPGNSVVATVMSNIGLEIALRRFGIVVHRCPVGDRDVFNMMQQRGSILGGEQSGHVIFSDLLPTGDGLLSTLSVLNAMFATGRGLSKLCTGLEISPQVLLNVEVRTKPRLQSEPEIIETIKAAEEKLGADGRVLVRYSGTEPLLRIMVEGPDVAVVEKLADKIAKSARKQLGT